MDISNILKTYDLKNVSIATLGSHSALDICAGSKKYGLRTIVVAQKGREKTYAQYYRRDANIQISAHDTNTYGGFGCVDEVITLEKFRDVLRPETQEGLRRKNAVFVPHRSFTVYLDFDYDAIEQIFEIPMVGNRHLLKIEERNIHPNQYDLLRGAEIRMPKIFQTPDDIDRPVIVKALEKERGFERAFFIISTPQEYQQKTEQLLQKGVVTEKALRNATIEEFVLGAQVNLNYFYSPVYNRLEFMGSDTRRQTNIEGFLRLPAAFQKDMQAHTELKYEESGHIVVTLLESMLEDVFSIGERFVAATQKLSTPGIIGPFALQTCIVPGPPKKEFVVFDVSTRMPGSPGVRFTPYTQYLWGESLSMGERIAREIQEAQKRNSLLSILT